MRMLIALACGSLLLLSAAGCAKDPAKDPGFKPETINPSNTKMGTMPSNVKTQKPAPAKR